MVCATPLPPLPGAGPPWVPSLAVAPGDPALTAAPGERPSLARSARAGLAGFSILDGRVRRLERGDIDVALMPAGEDQPSDPRLSRSAMIAPPTQPEKPPMRAEISYSPKKYSPASHAADQVPNQIPKNAHTARAFRRFRGRPRRATHCIAPSRSGSGSWAATAIVEEAPHRREPRWQAPSRGSRL